MGTLEQLQARHGITRSRLALFRARHPNQSRDTPGLATERARLTAAYETAADELHEFTADLERPRSDLD